MKNIYYFLISLIILIIACSSNDGKKFVGNWKAQQNSRYSSKIYITESGSSYKVKYGQFYLGQSIDADDKTWIASYDEKADKLMIDGGEITFDKQNNSIWLNNNEYKKEE